MIDTNGFRMSCKINAKIGRTREKMAGNWEIMQFVGRLFNTQRASVVVMRS